MAPLSLRAGVALLLLALLPIVSSRTEAAPRQRAQGTPPPAVAEAERLLRQGQVQAAHDLCARWVEANPGDGLAWVLLGRIRFVQAEQADRGGAPPALRIAAFRRARETLERALRLIPAGTPVAAEASHARGFCYYREGDFDQALRAFDRAIDWGARSSDIYRLRGLCQWRRGNLERALEDVERATQIDPDNLAAHLLLSEVLNAGGKHEDALAMLSAFVERRSGQLSPKQEAKLLFEMFGHALARNDIVRARKCLERATKLTPDETELWLDLAVLHYRAGGFVEAKATFERALTLENPPLIPRSRGLAHRYLGVIALHEGDPETARRQLEECLRWIPNDASALKNLGTAWRKLGDDDKAREALERFRFAVQVQDEIRQRSKAVDRRPTVAENHARLMESYLKIGWIDQARKQLEELRAFHPRSPLLERLERDIRERESALRSPPRKP